MEVLAEAPPTPAVDPPPRPFEEQYRGRLKKYRDRKPYRLE
jgi:hypothetical protein